MINLDNYSIETYTNLELNFSKISNSIEKNLKLYLLYNRMAQIYEEKKEAKKAENFFAKANEALANLPEGEDKKKAISIADRVSFSEWI